MSQATTDADAAYGTGAAYRYLRDPVFQVGFALYLANRFAVKPAVAGGFAHDHANDLLCAAVCLPPLLWAMRRLGLRRHDGYPTRNEIVVPLALWSVMFEVWLPTVPAFGFAAGDMWDVACYWLGGLAAAVAWRLLDQEPPPGIRI